MVDLRPIPINELWKLDGNDENSLHCTKCRKKLREYVPKLAEIQPESENSEDQSSSEKPSSKGSTVNYQIDDTIEMLLEVSPVKIK